MLYTIAVVLLILWALGLVSAYTMGGFIHVLLVIAVVVILLTLDRMPTNDLVMTQELVASMLGVRREGITQAAGSLQEAGVIRYRRGHISVTQRAGLESRACECYAVVKKEMDRLLSDVRHRQGIVAAVR